ncbi:single-stranded DNA-binding protein [Gryllotalpicola reticulitermitis]|uniref:Single-stranded DNA-binding protein n=1 Tax=Gryllotalpicola reticulitermitis TaxID=1184153 RepID=A0ABV8QAX9_9MICO
MSDQITVTGIVGTEPKQITTSAGLAITSFRLASQERRFDQDSQSWVHGETNWYTVSAFRQLADNTAASLQKGDHVIVTGRLRIRPWQAGDKGGTDVQIDADALGPDLNHATATVTRRPRAAEGEPAAATATGPAQPVGLNPQDALAQFQAAAS